jgi:hypothetical protein
MIWMLRSTAQARARTAAPAIIDKEQTAEFVVAHWAHEERALTAGGQRLIAQSYTIRRIIAPGVDVFVI